MHFIVLVLAIYLAGSLDCNIDKSVLKVNETYNNIYQLSISNNDNKNANVFIPKHSYYSSSKQSFIIFPNTQSSFQITLKNVNETLNDEIILIYCYDQLNPEDNTVLKVKIVNDYNLCKPDSLEVVEGYCNDDLYMTISYKYKATSQCRKTVLPPNETIRCYKKSLIKPSSIASIVILAVLVTLWCVTIYFSYKHYNVYKQHLPPQYIVIYSFGTILISCYETFLSFVNNNSECIFIIFIGAIAHGIHSSSALSLSQYMYYEDKNKLVVKNSVVFITIRMTIILILQIILFLLGYFFYYKYGKNINLYSGLTYTMSFCDNNSVIFIYIIPLLIQIITIHYNTLYNLVSKSSTLYLYQIWRVSLSCMMLTYYIIGMFISKDFYISPNRIYFGLTVVIIHIFSHFIYYSLSNDVKKQNLRPKLATNILVDDIYRECFRLYLEKDKLDNLLCFWEDCQLYRKFTINHFNRVHPMLGKIISTYLSVNAIKPINIIPNEVRNSILKYYENPNENEGSEVLDKAAIIVYNQLENHFPWFLKSPESEYIEEPYSWLEEYSDYHKSLQYSIRIRMCENAVTDKETGFSYPMSRGRITNPNSCFQLEDIPTIFGTYRNDLKNKIEGMNQASPPLPPIVNGGGVGVGLIAKYNAANNNRNNNNNDQIDPNDNDLMSRGNIYIPATCQDNEGCMAYGYATLATEYSVGGFTAVTHKTMKSVKIGSTNLTERSNGNVKNDSTSL